MRSLRAGLQLIAALTILTYSSPGFAQSLPRVTLECPSDIQHPSSPFELHVTVSWEGDAESHVIVPPEPVLPKSISLRSSSFETTVNDFHYQLTYRFILVPHQTGKFTIYPIGIHCWPRDSSTELSLLTNECSITVEPVAWLPQKKISGIAAAIMLAIIATAAYIIKKRAKNTRPPGQLAVDTDQILLQQCRRECLRGNYAAFYTTALKAAHSLLPTDQALHKRIAACLEKIQFSSQKPAAGDAEHVLRQLERARNLTEQT